jgi:hypothetical protein
MLRDDDTAPRGALYLLGTLLVIGVAIPIVMPTAPEVASVTTAVPAPFAGEAATIAGEAATIAAHDRALDEIGSRDDRARP